MAVTERTYRALVLEDPDREWELHRGRLREREPMPASHDQSGINLAAVLVPQLDRKEFTIRVGSGRLMRSEESYYIPALCVVPMRLVSAQLGLVDWLEVYAEPLPLVLEIWSPSTGRYDLEKIAESGGAAMRKSGACIRSSGR